jgi:hypothetical protein
MYTVPAETEAKAGRLAVVTIGKSKPFVETTGPEKVVVAILKPHMRVMGRICLHVVSRKLSDTPVSSGFLLVYTTYFCNAQTKSPSVRTGKLLKGYCNFNVSLNLTLVNILYPPHEHFFA